MNYEIKLGREIINNILHIIVGAIIAHTFLAYLPIYYILGILLIIGAGREYWQYRKGKIQPLYIHIIDTVTLTLGGLLWFLVITYFNLNINKL